MIEKVEQYVENIEDFSDTVDGTITPISEYFEDYLKNKKNQQIFEEYLLREDQQYSEEIFSSNLVEEEHKLIDGSLDIDYAYGLKPIKKNGDIYFVYGISATKNAKDIQGFILHHTSDAHFINILNYISKYDPDRRGQFGYHFLIDREGKITQAAPLHKRTNHVAPGTNDYRIAQKHLNNNNTISVSLHGGYKKIGSNYVHIPSTAKQLDSAYQLVSILSEKYGVDIGNSWGHGEVQSNRMPEEALELARRCRGEVFA